jgi:hypothetical protein
MSQAYAAIVADFARGSWVRHPYSRTSSTLTTTGSHRDTAPSIETEHSAACRPDFCSVANAAARAGVLLVEDAKRTVAQLIDRIGFDAVNAGTRDVSVCAGEDDWRKAFNNPERALASSTPRR